MANLPPDEEQVENAREWIETFAEPTTGVIKETGRRTTFSYGLKHIAEKWAGSYISNDALIEAARELDIELAGDGGPNYYLALKPIGVRWPRADRNTFYDWLVTRVGEFGNRIDDLAEDVLHDISAPVDGSVRVWTAYLDSVAGTPAMETFFEALELYCNSRGLVDSLRRTVGMEAAND